MKKTNIEKLKEILKLFLMMDVKETDFSPLIVQHPIFEYGTYYDENRNKVSILEPEGLERMIKLTEKRIEKCASAAQCMAVMRKSYYLTFLKFTREYLSDIDFAELLRYAWTESEAPNKDINVTQREILDWFRKVKKMNLMSEEDFRTYTELPEHIIIYRGVGSRSRRDGISWTIDKEKAVWFSNRFSDGYVIQGVADKKDVLGYFDIRNEKEIIISPRKVKEKIRLS